MTTASQTPGEPAELDALVALAQREHRAGRLAEAAAAYRQILVLWPNIAEAYNNLGNVLVGQGKLDEAAAQYERATALKPDLFQAHNNLGNIHWKQGMLDQAVARFEDARSRFRPDLAEAHNNLGNVLKDQGKFDEAAARYQRAVALGPDLAEGRQNNLGNALKEQGRFDQALAGYERALALRPDYAEAHYRRTDLKTFHAHDADLAALEAFAADTDRLPPAKMLYVHFALGKALEDVGDYGRAFEHLLQGDAAPAPRSQVR